MQTLKFLLTFIGCLSFASLSAQLQPVEDFIEKYPEGKKYFIYQSTLRMLNQERDADFDRLIKDLKKINAYVYEEKSGVSIESFNRMVDELIEMNFELMLLYRQTESTVRLLGQDRGTNSRYVLAVVGDTNFALIEMDGQLDLKYLKSLQGLDFSRLGDIVLDTKKM